MNDREMVIQHFQDAIEASGNNNKWRFVRLDIIEKALALLKEQEEQLSIKTENFNRLVAKVEVMPKIVRCKDCIHRGKSEKCVLATISEEKDYPLFMLDNRGEWFCADGERSESE